MNLQIVFENEHFIVVDKEAGVLSTPARFQEEDKRLCLGTYLQDHLRQQIYPVHRLDYEVSGLVLYAKSAESHRDANSWFERKQVQKTYRALAQGPSFEHLPPQVPRKPAGLQVGAVQEWKCRILRGKKRAYERKDGKPSTTLATYLGFQKDVTAWDLNPVTGRSHQLRYEMSRHGYPILGDGLYGSEISYGEDRIALRSYRIDFSEAPNALSKWGLPAVVLVDVEL